MHLAPALTRRLPPIAAALLAVALLAFPIASAGCASTQTASAADLGEPPQGYDSWDDYWEDKDREYREFERDRRAYQLQRPRLPGGGVPR